MKDTATAVPKTRRINRTGLETKIELSAGAILVAGIVGAFAVACGSYLMRYFAFGLVLCTFFAVSAFATCIILRSLAEMIRLRKYAAGIPFDGHISGPYDETFLSCSNCGARLISMDRCDCCNARLIQSNENETPRKVG